MDTIRMRKRLALDIGIVLRSGFFPFVVEKLNQFLKTPFRWSDLGFIFSYPDSQLTRSEIKGKVVFI